VDAGNDGKKLWEYFELKSTTRRLLSIFGHIFGIHFSEFLPNGADRELYTEKVSDYLKRQNLSWRNLKSEDELLVFGVMDTTFAKRGDRLGILVLDLLDREGKVKKAYCTKFSDVALSYPWGLWDLCG